MKMEDRDQVIANALAALAEPSPVAHFRALRARRPFSGLGTRKGAPRKKGALTCSFLLERTTGFEPATPTLARLCSTS